MSGPLERLTSGAGMQYSASLSNDGRMLFPNLTWTNNLWSIPIGQNPGAPPPEAQAITRDTTVKSQVSASRNSSKLAYSVFSGVERARKMELRVRDLLTGAESGFSPTGAAVGVPSRLSPDGRLLAYMQFLAGKWMSYLVEPGGVSGRLICEDCFVYGFAADATQAVVRYGDARVVRQDLASRRQTAIIEKSTMPISDADLSPDEGWLALLLEKPSGEFALRIAPVRESPVPEQDWIPVLDPEVWVSTLRWSPSGDNLFFLAELDGYACIWTQRLDPATKRPVGQPSAFYHAHSSHRSLQCPRSSRSFAVAKDHVIVNLGEATGNIWMAQVNAR
jgi:Tol biopolymer transport system component